MQNEQKREPFADEKAAFGFVLLLLETYAFSVKPLLHDRMGSRAFGLPAALVLLLIPIHAMCWYEPRGPNLIPMWYACCIYSIICVFHGLNRVCRRLRRIPEANHSAYDGRPFICYAFPRLSELAVKCWIEPIAVTCIGLTVIDSNRPLGSFIAMAGCSLWLSYAVQIKAANEDALDLRDQLMETKLRADRFRQQPYR